MFSIDMVFAYVGMISTCAFIAIAAGDFLVGAMNVLVSKTASKSDDAFAQGVTFWWGAIKEIYEDFRNFIDRFSAFSRPRDK